MKGLDSKANKYARKGPNFPNCLKFFLKSSFRYCPSVHNFPGGKSQDKIENKMIFQPSFEFENV